MGKYFMMSMRFNKKNAEDFGLKPISEGNAVNEKDGSIWKQVSLYDFGWGKENGYYRTPILNFCQLWTIVVGDYCDEDIYGAAAMIIEIFPDELLKQCEELLIAKRKKEDVKRVIKVFELCIPVNRCQTTNKTYSQVQEDYRRWKKISDIARTIK